MDDLSFTSAAEVASLIRAGDASPREVVDGALRRIEARDGPLNAFIEVDGERALAAADALEPGEACPFAGVPIAIKANVPVQGLCQNNASRFMEGYRPDHSAYLVRRLREAGFVIVGATNLPEFAILPTTEPRHTGVTRNPWDRERTPGGSSGGSAAAVAAGMIPLAHGNDGGGSLRIPAACCGLIGLKPSRGRVSRGPELGDSWLACDGVLTRTVADTALALDVLGGYEVGDANWAPRPVEPYTVAMRRDPGRLRIALTTENILGIEPDPECARGLRLAGEILAALGHDIHEVAPALPGPELMSIFISAFGPAVALGVNQGVLRARREPSDDEIEPLTRALYERAKRTASIAYLGAVAQLQALARGIVAFFADYDVLLTPALAERPLPIGECNGLGERPLEDLDRSARFTPYTSMFNITGQPAISVPVGLGPDGLPTGVQIAGKPLCEDTLLQLAAQLEAAHPWAHLRPEQLAQGQPADAQ